MSICKISYPLAPSSPPPVCSILCLPLPITPLPLPMPPPSLTLPVSPSPLPALARTSTSPCFPIPVSPSPFPPSPSPYPRCCDPHLLPYPSPSFLSTLPWIITVTCTCTILKKKGYLHFNLDMLQLLLSFCSFTYL